MFMYTHLWKVNWVQCTQMLSILDPCQLNETFLASINLITEICFHSISGSSSTSSKSLYNKADFVYLYICTSVSRSHLTNSTFLQVDPQSLELYSYTQRCPNHLNPFYNWTQLWPSPKYSVTKIFRRQNIPSPKYSVTKIFRHQNIPSPKYSVTKIFRNKFAYLGGPVSHGPLFGHTNSTMAIEKKGKHGTAHLCERIGGHWPDIKWPPLWNPKCGTAPTLLICYYNHRLLSQFLSLFSFLFIDLRHQWFQVFQFKLPRCIRTRIIHG